MMREAYINWILRPIVKHRLPGRLRIHIPALLNATKEFQQKTNESIEKLKFPQGIKSLQISFTTGNILINYRIEETTEEKVLVWVNELRDVAAQIWSRNLQLSQDKQQVAVNRLLSFLDKTIEDKTIIDKKLYLPDEIWS